MSRIFFERSECREPYERSREDGSLFSTRPERTRRARSNNKVLKGFSLLELVIAIGVLAIGLIGILQLFPMGLRASQRAGMISKAAFLAQRKMEDIRLAGFDAVSGDPPIIVLSGTEGDFDWGISIEESELLGVKNTEDIKKVILKISWSERDRIRSNDFVTYVAK